MECDEIEKVFEYSFDCGMDKNCLTLKVPINVKEMCSKDIPEFCARLINFHKIPCFVETELVSSMKKYLEEEVANLHSKNSSACIEMIRKNPKLIPKLVQSISEKYRGTFVKYADSSRNDIDEFPLAYHYLIHSAAMPFILKLETKYHSSLSKLITNREQCLAKMQERQQLEMARMCENVGFAFSNEDVTELASKHLTDAERLISQLDDKYTSTVSHQRNEFRQVLLSLYQEMKKNNYLDDSGPAYNKIKQIVDENVTVSSTRKIQNEVDEDSISRISSPNLSSGSSGVLMEESFTINLGAQLKTMHNVRLLVTNILNFCHYADEREAEAQRFQSSMSLYSNSLSAVVLLTDKRLGYKTGIEKDFSSVCLSSNEFHFEPLNEQLSAIQDHLSKFNKDGKTYSYSQEEGYIHLNEGDFYITKHSNLSQVHAVFHLAVDENSLQTKSSLSNVTSRHPVIAGLRQILKVCSNYDIGTLSLPLLLVHELTEEITYQWCIKRAELVMKCVKGFMMEMATWDGGISRTIQFVIPPGISEEAFDRMRSTLPEVFRTTSTRDLTRTHI